jgi:hypothetical protein
VNGKRRAVDGKVYLVRNTQNRKKYVGLTRRTLDHRWYMHVRNAERGKGSPYSLQQAIRELGPSAFSIELLATAKTLEDLATLEIEHIRQHGCLAPEGYNLNRGGAIEEGPVLRIVEGEEYWNLAELAEAYGILDITLQKRMQSGRWTLEQAVGIEPPPSLERGGLEVVVGEEVFPSLFAACKRYSVDKRIVDLRINRMGWSLDEAFGLVERSTNAFVVDGVEYKSVLAACRHYQLNSKLVDSRLTLNWTVEQAFNLVAPPLTQKRCPGPGKKRDIEYDGTTYGSIGELANAFGIKSSTLAYRLRMKWTLAEALGKALPPERNSRVVGFDIDGVRYLGEPNLCAAFGVDVSSFRFRQKAGWTIRQSLNLDLPPKRSSVAYIVTRPDGEEVYVEDLSAFAKRENLPRDGSSLRALAYSDKVHRWRGWQCRKAE